MFSTSVQISSLKIATFIFKKSVTKYSKLHRSVKNSVMNPVCPLLSPVNYQAVVMILSSSILTCVSEAFLRKCSPQVVSPLHTQMHLSLEDRHFFPHGHNAIIIRWSHPTKLIVTVSWCLPAPTQSFAQVAQRLFTVDLLKSGCKRVHMAQLVDILRFTVPSSLPHLVFDCSRKLRCHTGCHAFWICLPASSWY